MLTTKNNQPIIWMIDENKDELRTHSRILKRILPQTIEVIPVEAYPHKDDYLRLLEDSRTVCIITDERLKVTGIATYTGIELAQFLRGINPKIPLYILTNFPSDDEFIGSEWSVEDIVQKSDLIDKEKQKILAARILRRIDVYEDILGEREARFNSLLKKSMHGELEDSELIVLDELKLQRTSASLAKELIQIRQMEQIVQAHEALMNRFKYFIQKDDHDVI